MGYLISLTKETLLCVGSNLVYSQLYHCQAGNLRFYGGLVDGPGARGKTKAV